MSEETFNRRINSLFSMYSFYVSEAFRLRMKKEDPTISLDKENERMSIFRDVINDKIKYIRKTLGVDNWFSFK